MRAWAVACEQWGRTTSIALVVAALASSLVLIGAFTAPVYSTAGVSGTLSPTGEMVEVVSEGTSTIAGTNGALGAGVVAIPLVATLLVSLLLWPAGSRGLRVAAYAVVALLGAFTILSLMSIGIFLLPVTVALLVACVARDTQPSVRPLATSPAPPG